MTEFILKLSAEDIAVIDLGLQEVKLRLAGPLVQKINAQIQAQRLPPPDPSWPEEGEKQ